MTNSRYVSPSELQVGLAILFVVVSAGLAGRWPFAASARLWLDKLFASKFTDEQLVLLAELESHGFSEHIAHVGDSELPQHVHQAREALTAKARAAGLDVDTIQEAFERGAEQAARATIPDIFAGPLGG